jgi:GT2 family glycosyltransferase
MSKVPVLMITYNRLDYTKQALESLFNSKGVDIFIIDNGSTDGTQDWLYSQPWGVAWNVFYNMKNLGIAGAMNQFLALTQHAEFVGKVDNDTIVPPDWCTKLLAHMYKVDIVQAKHPILKATHEGGFDQWVSTMSASGALRYNHFVGGSGILFRRNIVTQVPQTDWMLGGWRQFQRDHPFLRKAFATDVEIQLLDTNEGGADYSQYPDYYKETKRL